MAIGGSFTPEVSASNQRTGPGVRRLRQVFARPDVLVLGGGGVLGEAWLRACLAGLADGTGWDPRESDAFVGTSAGSIVAAVLAAGRAPEAHGGAAAAWEPGLADGRDAGGGSAIVRGGLSVAGRAAAALAAPLAPVASTALTPAGARLRATVLRQGRPATGEIPHLRAALAPLRARFDGRLRVTAVDRASGRRVVFGAPGAPEADVVDAVLASCAVPWLFRAVEIGGREYVDGGAWSPSNLDAAPVSRGTRVLCLNPTASPRLAADRLGATRRFAGASSAAESLLLRRRGARVRVVAPDAATVAAIGPTLFDGARRGAVAAAGYAQGQALGRHG